VAPFFAAYAHPRVIEKCGIEVPQRIIQFNADFLENCEKAKLFSEADNGFSICQTLQAKTDAEKVGAEAREATQETTQDQKDMQDAMEKEAQSKIVSLEEAQSKIVSLEDAPVAVFCRFC